MVTSSFFLEESTLRGSHGIPGIETMYGVEFFLFPEGVPWKVIKSTFDSFESEFLCSILLLKDDRAGQGKERTRVQSIEAS